MNIIERMAKFSKKRCSIAQSYVFADNIGFTNNYQ